MLTLLNSFVLLLLLKLLLVYFFATQCISSNITAKCACLLGTRTRVSCAKNGDAAFCQISKLVIKFIKIVA